MAETTDPQGQTESIDQATLAAHESQTSRSNSIRSPWQSFMARNMTPPRLGSMLRDAANWAPDTLMKFAQEVEERDPHYRSVLSTRKLAITGLPWNLTPASEEARDVEVSNFVASVLEDGSFTSLLFDLLDGLSKGYSVVEIVWKIQDGQIVPAQYQWVDQKFLNFDQETQTQIQLVTEEEPYYGEPLQFGKFIEHVPKLKSGVIARSGLIFTVAALYLMKSYVTKDWLSFAEVFGMPMRWAEVTGNLTDGEKDEVFKALMALSSDATAIFDQNVKVEFKGVNSTAHGDFYEKAVRFWNQEISKVTLGQTMTSEDGSSLAQAKVHNDVRLDIRNADAKRLAETINEFLVAPIVDFNFGVGTPRPSFSFDTEESEDLEQFSASVSMLIDRGLRVPESFVLEKYGIPQAEEGERVLGVRTQVQVEETGDGGDGDEIEPPDVPDGEEAMSVRDAAAELGISVTQVYGMASAGELTIYKKGLRSRFLASEVRARAEVWVAAPFAGTTTGSIEPPESTPEPSEDTSSTSKPE